MSKEKNAVPMLVHSDGDFRKSNLEIRHKFFQGDSNLHWHDYYELEYVKSGSIVYEHNGNAYTLSPGSAFLVTPSDYHKVIANEVELYNIAFNDAQLSREFMERILSHHGETVVRLERSERELVERLLALLKTECERSDEFSDHAAGCLLETVLICFLRALPERRVDTKNRNSAVMQAVSYIHRHFKEKLTLRQVASSVHLSSKHLGELFKGEMGLSFSAYLLQTRLVFARSLLQSGRCTVSQVAFASGFSTPAYFSECYKKEYGYPPYQEVMAAEKELFVEGSSKQSRCKSSDDRQSDDDTK